MENELKEIFTIYCKYLPYDVEVVTLGFEGASSEEPWEKYPVIKEVLTSENLKHHLSSQ